MNLLKRLFWGVVTMAAVTIAWWLATEPRVQFASNLAKTELQPSHKLLIESDLKTKVQGES